MAKADKKKTAKVEEKPSKKGGDSKPKKSRIVEEEEDDDFKSPSNSSFKIQGEDHLGELFLVKPLSIEEGIATDFGTSDAIRADVVQLTGFDGDKPEEELGVLIFPRVLQGQLRGAIGKGMILGRLGQGQAKPKQDPPWRLEDPTGKDREIARAWLKKNPSFNPKTPF